MAQAVEQAIQTVGALVVENGAGVLPGEDMCRFEQISQRSACNVIPSQRRVQSAQVQRAPTRESSVSEGGSEGS